jgi:predicted amidophosphoribosyltransferase
MVCLACREFSAVAVCGRCARSLEPAPDRYLGPGVVVRSAWRHEGAGRALVHRLKYDGVMAAGAVLAKAMAARLEESPHPASALVPIPRATLRRVRYGADPGRDLARAVGRLAGVPVIAALRPPVLAPIRAGRPRAERREPRFSLRCPVPEGSVLVDDVVTTGLTLMAAAGLLKGSCGLAITATTALEINSSWSPERSKRDSN